MLRRTIVALLFVVLGACGGSGGGGPSNPSQTPPPAASGIGPAGGTVTAGGARVVIPAGALVASTAVTIEQSSQGAPPLPADLTGVGPMFAFTPHGTQFAAPVTVTVPYTESAAAGATPALYKTNAQNEWEAVAGAAFAAGEATASVSSFSWMQVVIPPLVRNEPTRSWTLSLIPGDSDALSVVETDHQVGGEVDRWVDFGPAATFTAEVETLYETRLPDRIANGYAFGLNDGVTYGVLAEAPDGRLGTPEPVGSVSEYFQTQSFIKRAADAKLRYTITALEIVVDDFNLPVTDGSTPLFGQLAFTLTAFDDFGVFYDVGGATWISGSRGDFDFEAVPVVDSQTDFWPTASLDAIEEDVELEFPLSPGQTCLGKRAIIRLKQPITLAVDLSSIDVDQEFTAHSAVTALAYNGRGGSGGTDCQAAYVGAFLRDPAAIGGTLIKLEGLEPTNRPLSLDSLQQTPVPEECSATDPELEAGVLAFEAANFVVDESRFTAPVIAVTRTGGAVGAVSVAFATSDGTALADIDYSPTNTRVKFADGQSGRRLIAVPVHRDALSEGNETIQLQLSSPGGCASLGAQTTATLTIRDGGFVLVPTFTIGGSVAGLAGTGLELQEITTGARVTPTADGDFTFPYDFPLGSLYDVRVKSQPTSPIQTCNVGNATGTVGNENVTDLNVVCATQTPPGGLDATFGSGGRVTTGLTGGADAVALQADGKLVVLGNRRMARYGSDGSLDTGFGVGGEVPILFFGTSNDGTRAVALQSDGKIVVAGVARPRTSNDFAVARFNVDGTIDSSLGEDGKAYVDFLGGHDEATSVLVLPDGRLLLTGFAADAMNNVDFAAAVLSPDGELDPSFGTNGGVVVDVAGELDRAYAAALQPDGKLVIAGEVRADRGDPGDVGVVRLDADGTLDTTFGTGGKVHIDYADSDSSDGDPGDFDTASDIALQPDGKIVIAGSMLVGSTSDYLVARLTADGSRDGSFGTNGLVTTAFGTLQDIAEAVAIQLDGKIVVAGSASSSAVTDFGLVRLHSDGTFDSSFGGGGALIVDFFGGADGANDLVVQPDGKLVAAGVARNGAANGVGLVRVMP